MRRNVLVALCLLVGLVWSGCGEEGSGVQDPAKGDNYANLPLSENGAACSESPESWRCAYSEHFGAVVSQVCRSCESLTADQAAAWMVCEDGGEGSRWVNFNLSPADCASCAGSYSSGCQAEPELACNSASCQGCCGPEGICYPGTADTACGIAGVACYACMAGSSCVAGVCMVGAECTGKEDCPLGNTCLEGQCVESQCSFSEPCPEGFICYNGICASAQ